MTAAHLHLVLNHVPVVGIVLSALAMIYAWWTRSFAVKQLALLLVLFSGLSAIPAFLTGEPAEKQIQKLAGIEQEHIEDHEGAATLGLWGAILSAALAAGTIGLHRYKKEQPLTQRVFLACLGLTLVTAAQMGKVANKGGLIRHPEIEAEGK